jgi:uncharacterized protein YsxB (DUF464 family)
MANSIYRKNVGETRADALERTLKEIDIPQNMLNSEFRLKKAMVLLRKDIEELKKDNESIKEVLQTLLLSLIEIEKEAREYINLPWYKKLFKL